MVNTEYVCIRQERVLDCGVACVATILRHYGQSISIPDIRKVTRTTITGTSVFDIVMALRKYGFVAEALKGDPEAFMSPLPLPVIAHISRWLPLGHYVVVHNISKSREEITIADPAKGIVIMSPRQFLKCWSGVIIKVTNALQ